MSEKSATRRYSLGISSIPPVEDADGERDDESEPEDEEQPEP